MPEKPTRLPPDPPAEDVSEAETLRRLGKMDRFNQWMFSRIEPWVGRKILEVGCGLGNFTLFFDHAERIVGIDFNEKHIKEFRQVRPQLSQVELHTFDAGDPGLVELGKGSFDTVVCLNVLEHVEKHEQAIQSFYELLEPGGHLCLLVPAFPALFGTLDLNGPHFRRYTQKMLKPLLEQAGFEVLKLFYFNLFGIPGWWYAGKILKRPILPKGGLTLYEKLVPVFKMVETVTGPPVGLSLIAVARKPNVG
jgi:ubiquinone/menaquinone biosynthesis C-methylase UbiE